MLRTYAQDPEEMKKGLDKFCWFFEIEHSGDFQFKPLYQAVHRWFMYEGFTHWQKEDPTKPEDLYWVHEQPSGTVDLLCLWRLKKDINKYIRYFCKFDFQILGLKKKEIMFQGKKVKTDSLNITLRAWWWVQLDPNNLWKRSRFKFLMEPFYTYLYKDEPDTHIERLKVISTRLKDFIKTYFSMPSTEQHTRTFFPEYGFKWDKPKINPKDFEHIDRKPDPNI